MDWLKLFLHHVSSYGYYPNPSKCCLVVHHNSVSEAATLFSHVGIRIVTSHRFLGRFIGDSNSAIYGICFRESSKVGFFSS